jgi:hypothetical protein
MRSRNYNFFYKDASRIKRPYEQFSVVKLKYKKIITSPGRNAE